MYRVVSVMLLFCYVVGFIDGSKNNTLHIGIITTEHVEYEFELILASEVLNTSSDEIEYVDVKLHWKHLNNYTVYELLSIVEFICRTSDIVIIPEEFKLLIHLDKTIANIVWFSQLKFSETLWNRKMFSRAPEVACPMCKTRINPDVEDTFISCASDSQLKQYQNQQIENIILSLEWKIVLIIYDTEFEWQAYSLFDELSSKDIRVWLYTVDDIGYNKYPGLFRVYNQRGKSLLNVILLCSNNCINDVLLEVKLFDVKQKNTTALRLWSRWLILQDKINKTYLETGQLDIDNIVVMMDARQDVCLPTCLQTDVVSAIKNNYLELNNTQILSNITALKFSILQMFQIRAVIDKPKLATLLYRTKGRELAKVSSQQLTDTQLFPNTQFKFNNRKFVVSTNVWEPFTMKTIKGNQTIYTGICIDLLRELAVRLNFSYELIEPPDLDWGIVKDGRWTGLVGQLTRHEVDLVVAAVTISDQRETAIDFSFPYFFDYTGVFLKKPDPGIYKWYTLLAPFKWQVLLCILCALLYATFFLFTIETTNPYYDIKNNQSTRFSLDGALWYLLGALLAHGGVHIPCTMASRMIIGFWWIFSIIMAATYSGNLIAFLTVTRDTLPFETMAEMLEQDTYKWGIMGGSATETLFQNSSIDEYQEIWKKMVEFNKTDPDVFHPDQSVHLQKILAGNYAFLTDRSVLASWTNYSCNVSLLPEKIFPNHYALGLPNNSPYLDIFTNQMIQIYESGLLQIWKQTWWPRMPYCSGGLKTKAEAVDLQSLQSAFYIIAIGVFTALIILLAEVVKIRRTLRKVP